MTTRKNEQVTVSVRSFGPRLPDQGEVVPRLVDAPRLAGVLKLGETMGWDSLSIARAPRSDDCRGAVAGTRAAHTVSGILEVMTGEIPGWARRDDPYPRADRLALYVDFENLVLGAGGSLPGRAEPVPESALTWLCRAYGTTSIRRAYADWADPRFRRYQQALERNGVGLQQIGRGPQRKNAADIHMAVDAMETLINHPDIGAFVLVTGDSDFTPLVAKLREFGKHVVGVGAETVASPRLVSVCSEYKLWGSIVARVEPDTDEPSTLPGFALVDAEVLLVQAMEQLPSDTPTASQVKAKMLALDPGFDEANYGFSRFRQLLSHLGHRIRTVGCSGSDITVALRDTCPVDHDDDSQREAVLDVGKRLSIRDGASQDFPRMTSADHGNQQQSTSTSPQVSGGVG